MRPVKVAIAIIQRADKVLISQRLHGAILPDLWEFPGGKVEPNETPEQCLRREIQEELGIDVEIEKPFSTIDHAYPHLTVRLHPFLCTIGSAEPTALASQRLRWVAVGDLGGFAFPAANVELLKEIVPSLTREENRY
ncbi:MAG TPA: 8-oxo-dGTP diphosphatase MutT [Tepidisphaeraceae bacterium]|jgi:mutator protein MutT|nr:8-oxo-dGTP diphosphatase MutT [Tepidisphaeraceae bacterium]